MTDERKMLLLRFAELSLRGGRREISESETSELQEILKKLGLAREEALVEARNLIVHKYDKNSK